MNLVERLEKAYHHVRKQLHVVAEASKCYYDRSVREHQFKEGDCVHIYVLKKIKGRCLKLQSYYNDVGIVVRKVNDVAFVVRCKSRREDHIVHTDKLRLVREFERYSDSNSSSVVSPNGDRQLATRRHASHNCRAGL